MNLKLELITLPLIAIFVAGVSVHAADSNAVVTAAIPGVPSSVLVLRGVTVIDGTGAPPRTNLTVVVADGRIAALGKAWEVRVPTNSLVFDAGGKFLVPGFWDMHVHWYDKDYLPLFIANGVTGIRLMWGATMHYEWRRAIEDGSLIGPRLYIASTIIDGPKPIWRGSITAGNEAEGRQAVTQALSAGPDFIKVYSFLPRAAYFAIASEAKARGISFAGHVPISVSAEEASEAGQKSIEHLTGILAACSSRETDLLKTAQKDLADVLASDRPINDLIHRREQNQLALDTFSDARADALFAEFRKNQTWQCPTLVVLRNIRHLDDPAIVKDSRVKYMPREFAQGWDTATDLRFKDRTPEEAALGKKMYQKELAIVGRMRRAGVDLLAGTDTLNPYCFPGFSLHDELQLVVQAGLSPMEALQAATLNAARFMGREKELGTVETGKLADLVLLDANPLDDIANTRKISAVIWRGQYFPRAALDAMLQKVEAIRRAAKPPILEPLLKTILATNVEAAVDQYLELKASHSAEYDFSEPQLNHLGYQLMAMNRTRDAITILKLNAEFYPQSANVYDSLAEAYRDAGDKASAIQNYEKSLRLDPHNTNAIEQLNKLKAP